MASTIIFMTENKYGIMTNEEAIAILQSIKPVPYRGDCKSTTHLLVTAALDMAIKALKKAEMTKEQLNMMLDAINAAEEYELTARKKVMSLRVNSEFFKTLKELVADRLDYNMHIPVDEPCEDAVSYPETIFKRPCSNCANEDSINICDQCCFKYDSWFKKKEINDDRS